MKLVLIFSNVSNFNKFHKCKGTQGIFVWKQHNITERRTGGGGGLSSSWGTWWRGEGGLVVGEQDGEGGG